ncbi:MAG TPA: phosphate acyltransferase PlsX [Verrucomicrobiota bacterium]|nr:phosphate acyltransferase PlsX [Verrucomicrobiales bacterium]HRI14699.1 phosphate acyltransferase PlsX [Verrucomicrobiota bacterium]
MRLAVDVMGGDLGPTELLHGIQLGLAADSSIETIYVVGKEAELRPLAQQAGLTDSRVAFHHAGEVLTMEDDPALAVRRKKDSSLLRALELVRDGKADAAISSGNTGALVAGATFRLGRLEGVKRPSFACIMPSRTGAFVLLDAGANPECTPEILLQFAVMGSVYSRAMLGIEKPRVGVLSNGSEESKGTDLTRAAVGLIRKSHLNCTGYCEGFELFTDGVDVAVCDGFVGNLVLKTAEGLGKTVGYLLRTELTASPLRKFGAILASGGLKRIKARMNPETYGGAPVLGLHGSVVKIHGSARRDALKNAILQSARAVNQRLNDEIVREIAMANTAVSTL